MLLALGGGFPIYYEAAAALLRRKISADLAVGMAALAALWIGQYVVAADDPFPEGYRVGDIWSRAG